jgi:hypothetical protein
MRIKKNLFVKFLLVGTILCAGFARCEAKDIRVTLSDGSSLVLTEPVDVMGLTWEKVRNALPPVFLIVERGGMTDAEKIVQLLSTVNSVGQLYISQYDSVIGASEDGADMFAVEENLSKIKSGKGTDSETKSVLRGEAVALWGVMLSDKAEMDGLNPTGSTSAPSGEAFLDEYSRAVEAGENVDIYTEALINVARENPAVFSSYLDKVTPERRATLEKITARVNGSYSD